MATRESCKVTWRDRTNALKMWLNIGNAWMTVLPCGSFALGCVWLNWFSRSNSMTISLPWSSDCSPRPIRGGTTDCTGFSNSEATFTNWWRCQSPLLVVKERFVQMKMLHSFCCFIAFLTFWLNCKIEVWFRKFWKQWTFINYVTSSSHQYPIW